MEEDTRPDPAEEKEDDSIWQAVLNSALEDKNKKATKKTKKRGTLVGQEESFQFKQRLQKAMVCKYRATVEMLGASVSIRVVR